MCVCVCTEAQPAVKDADQSQHVQTVVCVHEHNLHLQTAARHRQHAATQQVVEELRLTWRDTRAHTGQVDMKWVAGSTVCGGRAHLSPRRRAARPPHLSGQDTAQQLQVNDSVSVVPGVMRERAARLLTVLWSSISWKQTGFNVFQTLTSLQTSQQLRRQAGEQCVVWFILVAILHQKVVQAHK